MTYNLTRSEQFKVKENYVASEADNTKDFKSRRNTGKRNPFVDSKKVRKATASRPENRPKKGVSHEGSKDGDSSPNGAMIELEHDIRRARFEIFGHFVNLETKMADNDKKFDMAVDGMVDGCLANIKDEERSPQNEFVINSLINNFEEIIGNIEQESVREVIHATDGIKKSLVVLVNGIEGRFREKAETPSTVVTAVKSNAMMYFLEGFLILMALFLCVTPDYIPESTASAPAENQPIIVVLIFFYTMYLMWPSYKKCFC